MHPTSALAGGEAGFAAPRGAISTKLREHEEFGHRAMRSHAAVTFNRFVCLVGFF